MDHTWSNIHLIRTFAKPGHSPEIVMQRCCDHLGWQGPHPHLWEVQMIMSAGCRSGTNDSRSRDENRVGDASQDTHENRR